MVITRHRGYETSRIHYLLIVLFGMNLLGRGSIVCTIFAVYAFLRLPKKNVMDVDALCALVMSLGAFVSSMVHYGMMEAIKGLNFFLMYFIGLNGYYASKNRKVYIEKSLFSIFAGYALFVALTWFGNRDGMRMLRNNLVINNIWTGEQMATTLAGLLSSVVIGYFFYALVCQPVKRKKLYAIIALIITMILNMETATRTPIVLLVINLIAMTAIYLADQKGKKAFWTFLSITVLIPAIVMAVALNAFGILTMIMESPIFLRFVEEGLNTSRTDIMLEHFKFMLDYPWGGEKIRDVVGAHAHNFLQQGHDYYGILVTIPLLVLAISFVQNLCHLSNVKGKNGFDYLFISMYLSMLIQACMEPVFTGYPCFMFSLLLIHGIANGYLKTRSGEFCENC